MIKVPELAISYFNSNYTQIISSGNLAEGQWNDKLAESVVSISGQKYAVPTCSNGAGMMALLQIYKEYYGRKKVMIQSWKESNGCCCCKIRKFTEKTRRKAS